jgi:hypothetical protein
MECCLRNVVYGMTHNADHAGRPCTRACQHSVSTSKLPICSQTPPKNVRGKFCWSKACKVEFGADKYALKLIGTVDNECGNGLTKKLTGLIMLSTQADILR